jgi:predicted patatin/cPLA2 family phospholipase
VKRASALTRPVAALLARTPAVARASLHTAQRYQDAVRFIHAPPADARIVELAPAQPLKTKRTTQDPACLRADYESGHGLAHGSRERLAELLS